VSGRQAKPIRATKSEQYANIELLLRNWRRLEENIQNTLSNQDALAWRKIELLMDNPFMDRGARVESLTRQRQYTQIIYEHFKTTLENWMSSNRTSPAARLRRRLIQGLYLQIPRKTLKSFINDKHSIGTLGKELEKAKRELATLVFGANGLLKTNGTAYGFAPELLKTALSSADMKNRHREQSHS
jgi:hypothetical protein